MAKIVIAGKADCPYYAKCELLGDLLKKNLPNFKLHKVVVQPNEWDKWLKNTCNVRGWKHSKSPIVWRELIDRGGKGMLIGGANDFQEYAMGYYDIKSDLTSDDVTKIAVENLQTKKEIDEEERLYKAKSKPVHVCITNASSPVCYNMVNAIARGDCLGPDVEIALHLYDTQDKLTAVGGIEMEAFDLACPLLRQITVTSNIHQAFSDCAAIILLDELLQQEGETKNEWLVRNSEHFVKYIKVISDFAKKDVKVIVAGDGPINFNAFMMTQNAGSVPKQNIVAMSRMVENRAKAVLAQRLNVNSAHMVDVLVWGNPNGQHYIDVSRARVHQYDGAIWGPPSFSLPATDMVADDKWLQTEFLDALASRRETIEGAMKHRASVSLAAAAATLLRHWFLGSPANQVFSLGVYSDGTAYDVPEGLVFSLPVRFTETGYWEPVEDIVLGEEQQSQLQLAVQDLMTEKYATFPHLKPPSPEPPVIPEEDEAKKVFGEAAEQDSSDAKTSGESSQGESSSEAGDKPSLEKITEDTQGEEQAVTPPTTDTPAADQEPTAQQEPAAEQEQAAEQEPSQETIEEQAAE